MYIQVFRYNYIFITFKSVFDPNFFDMVYQGIVKSIFSLLFVLFLSLSLFGKETAAAQSAGASIFNAPPPDSTGPKTEMAKPIAVTASDGESLVNVSGVANPLGSVDFLLSLAVLFFGLVVVILEVYLAHIGKIGSDHIFKCIILTLVITGSIVLITAGYSNNQITGVVGIMGSIAGYMLGKTIPADKNAPVPDAQNSVRAANSKTDENG